MRSTLTLMHSLMPSHFLNPVPGWCSSCEVNLFLSYHHVLYIKTQLRLSIKLKWLTLSLTMYVRVKHYQPWLLYIGECKFGYFKMVAAVWSCCQQSDSTLITQQGHKPWIASIHPKFSCMLVPPLQNFNIQSAFLWIHLSLYDPPVIFCSKYEK